MARRYLQYIPDDDSGSVRSQLMYGLHELGGMARSIELEHTLGAIKNQFIST